MKKLHKTSLYSIGLLSTVSSGVRSQIEDPVAVGSGCLGVAGEVSLVAGLVGVCEACLAMESTAPLMFLHTILHPL